MGHAEKKEKTMTKNPTQTKKKKGKENPTSVELSLKEEPMQ